MATRCMLAGARARVAAPTARESAARGRSRTSVMKVWSRIGGVARKVLTRVASGRRRGSAIRSRRRGWTQQRGLGDDSQDGLTVRYDDGVDEARVRVVAPAGVDQVIAVPRPRALHVD